LLSAAKADANPHFIEVSLTWLAGLAIVKQDAVAESEIEAVLAGPQAHAPSLGQPLRELVNQILPRKPDAVMFDRTQCLRLSRVYLRASEEILLEWHKGLSAEQRQEVRGKPPEWVNQLVHQLDFFASELRFSAQGHAEVWGSRSTEVATHASVWWSFGEAVLVELEKWMHPHIAHALVEGLAALLPFTPERCLHWLNRICKAGAPMGLLHERLATDDIVAILQRCLSEHRGILRANNTVLSDAVECLESLLSVANTKAIELAAAMEEFYR
jgi:hypothetical protein